MVKKRIITLAITFALLLIYIAIGNMYQYGWTDVYPRWARTMLVVTMIYTMGGCMLQTVGFRKASTALSVACFVVMCICLFYSSHWCDYVMFAICIAIILYRAAKHCSDCQDNDRSCNTSITHKAK